MQRQYGDECSEITSDQAELEGQNIGCFIQHLCDQTVATYYCFLDCRLVCLMSILVYLATSLTDLNHLICHLIACYVSPSTLSFPLHHYVCSVLYINDQNNQPDGETLILQLLSLVGPAVPCGPLPPQWPCSIHSYS